MKSAERRHRAKLHYLARGRADGVVAVGLHLQWTAAQIYRVAEAAGVEFQDARAALIRARECTPAEVRATAYSEVDA